MEWLTVPLGLIIGIAQGAVGAGGSIIAVPLLVYLVDVEAKEAVTAALIVVGLVSLTGMAIYSRAGRVRFASGSVFGMAGVGASVGGSFLNRAVDPDVLLLSFAGLMALAAGAMARSHKSTADETQCARGWGPSNSHFCSGRAEGGRGRLCRRVRDGILRGGWRVHHRAGTLSLVLGYAIHEAIGTALLVTVINSVAALLSRLDTESLPVGGDRTLWSVAGLVGVGAGSLDSGKD